MKRCTPYRQARLWVTLVGILLGIASLYLGKITTYGIWLVVLIGVCLHVAWRLRSSWQATVCGLLLWTVALGTNEGILSWIQWYRYRFAPDWEALGIGVLLILLIGWPVSLFVSRWALQHEPS